MGSAMPLDLIGVYGVSSFPPRSSVSESHSAPYLRRWRSLGGNLRSTAALRLNGNLMAAGQDTSDDKPRPEPEGGSKGEELNKGSPDSE